MRTSAIGIDLIKRFEGCRLSAYLCPAGILTVGYGHTGSDVHSDSEITQEQAERLLVNDLRRFEASVIKSVTIPLAQCQFDALVSFSFNLGLGSLKNSTLLRKLNAGDYVGASTEFLKWNKIRDNGKLVISNGLGKRRLAEQVLFSNAAVK